MDQGLKISSKIKVTSFYPKKEIGDKKETENRLCPKSFNSLGGRRIQASAVLNVKTQKKVQAISFLPSSHRN